MSLIFKRDKQNEENLKNRKFGCVTKERVSQFSDVLFMVEYLLKIYSNRIS
jgi:hypothetical protein